MRIEKTPNLLPEQFYDALKKGQGRAYWHIDPNNHERYRARLLDLCTRTTVYDPFNEEDRAAWLYKLLKRTGVPNSYKDEITEALYSTENQLDLRQIFRLVGEFAKHDAAAFHAFCDNAPRLIANLPNGSLASTLLGFALRDGLLDVAELIGKSLAAQPYFELDANAWLMIHTQIDTNTFIATVLEWLITGPAQDDDRFLCEEPDDEPVKYFSQPAGRSVNEIFDIAQSKIGTDPTPYAIWAATEASEQDLVAAFERLLQEDRPDVQMRLLWVFQNKPMPRLEFRILYLALSENLELKKAAVQALSNLQNPEVRNLAFRLLAIFPNALHDGALSLFFNNYESEDAATIERVLSVPQDVHLCQALCEQILTLYQKQTDEPELTNLLLWAYENTPSSATRFEIVRLLIELNAAPRTLLEEACHDCDSMTRQFAPDALE